MGFFFLYGKVEALWVCVQDTFWVKAKYLSPVLLKRNLKFPSECFPEHQPTVIKIWSGVLLCSQVYVYSALWSKMPCASGVDLAWRQGTVAAQVQCYADMPSAFSTQMSISYGFVLCCVVECLNSQCLMAIPFQFSSNCSPFSLSENIKQREEMHRFSEILFKVSAPAASIVESRFGTMRFQRSPLFYARNSPVISFVASIQLFFLGYSLVGVGFVFFPRWLKATIPLL